MHMRAGTVFVLGIGAAALAAACGGNHQLFGDSAGAGAGATQATSGTAGSPGVGGASSVGSTSTGLGGATTVASSSSGSPATTATSSSSAATTTSSSSGSTTYPAPFPDPPQVITFNGLVLASPQIYPVFFSNDDAATVASLADFSMNAGGTPWWTAATSEYGVGTATGHAAIKLGEAAPASIDDSAIQQWLAQKFADPSSGFPTPDANTLIAIYYPAGSTITLQGSSSCQTFGGYHNSAQVGSQQVAYAVVPRCGDLDMTTGDASHELVEAATDPHPMVDPAYAQVDEGDLVWELLLGGGEVGDMCAQFPGVFAKFSPFAYTVQRTWSNKAASAGHDPCVPELPGEVYFNSAPALPDMANVNVQGQQATLKAVQIPVGSSKTIDVHLYSDGPIGPWTVAAVDPGPMLGAGNLLGLSLDKSSGKNGDVLKLTINVLKAGPGNVEVFYLKSTLGSQETLWFGTVAN